MSIKPRLPHRHPLLTPPPFPSRYFGADHFSFGSTFDNWPALAEFAARHNMLFVPSVAPGYVDVQVRPWNSQTTRERQDGKYYARSVQAALGLHPRPSIISITSFNEWHEGTQIERAVAKSDPDHGRTYLAYPKNNPDFYLLRTRDWVDTFAKS